MVTTTTNTESAGPGPHSGGESVGRHDLDDRYGSVAELFGALAAPVRAAIIHLLTVEERSVGELVDALGLSQPLVSQHLRTLRTAGLVSSDRRGRVVIYRLADEHVSHVFLDAFQHSHE